MAAHINDSLYSDFGWKVRRQDGKKFTPDQLDLLRTAAEEIDVAFPHFDFAWRYSGLLIEHASGDFIRHQSYKALGIYCPPANKVVVCPTSCGQEQTIWGLAHELGHALDWISAHPLPILNKYLAKEEQDSKTGFNFDDLEDVLKTNHLPILQIWADLTPVESDEYWAVIYNTKTECWARLFEQYVAYRLRQARRPAVSAMPWEHYVQEIGFWTEAEFNLGLADTIQQTAYQMLDRIRQFANRGGEQQS